MGGWWEGARRDKVWLGMDSNPFSVLRVFPCVNKGDFSLYFKHRKVWMKEEGALSSRIEIVWLIKDGKQEKRTSVFGFGRDGHGVSFCWLISLSPTHTHNTHTKTQLPSAIINTVVTNVLQKKLTIFLCGVYAGKTLFITQSHTHTHLQLCKHVLSL